jgi:hypothetical protein
MSDALMKCGHSAQGINGTGKPVCLICMCEEIAESKPDLTGRKARCSYFGKEVYNCETHYPKMLTTDSRGKKHCGSLVDSSYSLPFFEYKPNSKEDSFYCGCMSWD